MCNGMWFLSFLVYFWILSILQVTQYDGRKTGGKWSIRFWKWSWGNEGANQAFAWKTTKFSQKSQSLAKSMRHILNTSSQCYHWTSLLNIGSLHFLNFLIRNVIIKYKFISSWMFELFWLISIYLWTEIQQNFFHMALMIAQQLRKAVPIPEVLPSI